MLFNASTIDLSTLTKGERKNSRMQRIYLNLPVEKTNLMDMGSEKESVRKKPKVLASNTSCLERMLPRKGNHCGAPNMLALNSMAAHNTNNLGHGKCCLFDMSDSHLESAVPQTPGAKQTCSGHVLAEQTAKTPVQVTPTQDQVAPTQHENFNREHLFTKVSKRRLAELERDASLMGKIRKALKKKKYVGSKVGRKLTAMALLHAPKLGLEAASTMNSLFLSSFFANIVFDEEMLKGIPNCTPCAKTMRDLIFDATVDSILLERERMASLPITLLCDKGDGRKAREGANFVKLVAKYNHDTEEVELTCIGISSTGNDSRSAAENINHCLLMYDTENDKIFLVSQGTDAGGGATREDLGRKLEEVGRRQVGGKYNVSTCTLHALNVALSNATESTMGGGGLKKRTALQCLHSA